MSKTTQSDYVETGPMCVTSCTKTITSINPNMHTFSLKSLKLGDNWRFMLVDSVDLFPRAQKGALRVFFHEGGQVTGVTTLSTPTPPASPTPCKALLDCCPTLDNVPSSISEVPPFHSGVVTLLADACVSGKGVHLVLQFSGLVQIMHHNCLR